MNTQRLGQVVGPVALALLVARCGGTAERPDRAADVGGGGTRVEACDLVPKSDMEAIVGATVVKADGRFDEHTYTKPTSYTATCMYMGERAVVLGVNYPNPQSQLSSAALAASVTEQLRSQETGDPATDEVFRATQVRPVEGLPGSAAAYEMVEQTHLEVRGRGYTVKVVAPSLDHATQVAAKVFERLPGP